MPKCTCYNINTCKRCTFSDIIIKDLFWWKSSNLWLMSWIGGANLNVTPCLFIPNSKTIFHVNLLNGVIIQKPAFFWHPSQSCLSHCSCRSRTYRNKSRHRLSIYNIFGRRKGDVLPEVAALPPPCNRN